MMRFCLFYIAFSIWAATGLRAQDSVWTLSEAVDYALVHNIDLNESVLNGRLSRLQLQQSRRSMWPDVSLSVDYGRSFGRSVDPTSNQFVNSNYDFSGLSGNANVLLFGWFQKRHRVHQNEYLWQAAASDYDQLKDDVSLNVATAFLRILLAKEQISIATQQVKFSIGQLAQTEAFVNSGRLPELNRAQMEAQVATDSAGYFAALSDYQSAILDMKALMNLDIADPFSVAVPDITSVSVKEIMSQSPQQVYAVASANFSGIESSKLKADAAVEGLKASKAALYPQLGLSLQAGSNYSSSLKEMTDFSVVGASPTGTFVEVGGASYPVMQPDIAFSSRTTPFFTQLGNNFRQIVALNLTIPLLNGWQARTAVAQAKIDVAHQKLEKERAYLTLKQDVYQAYDNARSAAQKYYASVKAADAAQRALDFAEKRYELGLLNTVELLTTQNANFKAQSDAASAKYDLIFKLKVIDYYLGKKLEL